MDLVSISCPCLNKCVNTSATCRGEEERNLRLSFVYFNVLQGRPKSH